MVFSPDGATLAGGEWSDILLWEVETGDLKARLEGHADEVVSLAFSPDGATLASGSEDGRVRTWDVERGKPESIFPAGARMPVAISPDGAVLASGSGSWVLLWDLETGRTRATLNGHEGEDRWSFWGRISCLLTGWGLSGQRGQRRYGGPVGYGLFTGRPGAGSSGFHLD